MDKEREKYEQENILRRFIFSFQRSILSYGRKTLRRSQMWLRKFILMKFMKHNPLLRNIACYDIGKIIEVVWCNCGQTH
jgi:hypothetical protein